jgi:hypothetical protein
MLSPPREIPPFLALLLVPFFAGVGCSDWVGENPPLADSTFTRVLVDLHMTTARGGELTKLPPHATDSVLAFHQVQREDFDATLRYYTQHPDAFAELYDAVIDTLGALRNRPLRPSTDPSTRPDSIRHHSSQ